jgi:hypothetical protein
MFENTVFNTEHMRGVPNKVNDTVAPWGLILRQLHVYKKCRSLLDLLRKKKKKNPAKTFRELLHFF